MNEENRWQSIREVPESDTQRRLQRALLRTAVVDLKHDAHYAEEFQKRAEISLQKLATIFLGHSFEIDELKELLSEVTAEEDTFECYDFLERVHLIRELINYDHTNPTSVFYKFCEFLVKFHNSLSVVGFATDVHDKPRLAYIYPYHAPSFPGLTEHIKIESIRDSHSTRLRLTVVRVNWESFNPAAVGILEPAPEPH